MSSRRSGLALGTIIGLAVFALLLGSGFALDYLPVDGMQNATASETGLLAFLSASRNYTGGTYSLVTPPFKDTAHGLGLAFLFNQSTDNPGSYGRLFVQVNGSFWASDMLTDYGTGGGNVRAESPLYFQGLFQPNSYLGKDIYIRQQMTGPAAVGACFLHLDKINGADIVRLSGVCQQVSANPDILLMTGITTVADLKAAPFSLDLNANASYVIHFASGTAADIALPFGNLGSREVTFQNIGALEGASPGTVQSAMLLTDNTGSAFIGASSGSDGFKSVYLSGYSLAPLGSHFVKSAGGLLYLQDRTAVGGLSTEPVIASVHYTATFSLTGDVTRDQQTGSVFIKAPANSMSSLVRCPSPVPVLSSIPVDIVCPEVNVYQTDDIAGSLIPAPNTAQSFNNSLFPVAETLTPRGHLVSVSDAATGAQYLTQYGGLGSPWLIIKGQVFSQNFTRSYVATITPYGLTGQDGAPLSVTFPIRYIVVPVLPFNVTAYPNHRAVFFALESNATADNQSVANMRFDIGNNATGCTTRLSSFTQDNQTMRAGWCSVSVPNSLLELNTTASYFSRSLNATASFSYGNVYYGSYATESLAPFGIFTGSYGSAYFATWDDDAQRFIVTLHSETCLDPQLSIENNNNNERCKLKGCPAVSTIGSVNGTGVSAFSYTCSVPAQKTCVMDATYGVAYLVTCGNSCEPHPRLCPTAACNADFSGCSTDLTGAQQAATGDVFHTNFWLKWLFVDHLDFTVGAIIAIVLFIIPTALGAPVVGMVLGAFVLLGTILLTLPYGLLVFLTAGALVLFGGVLWVVEKFRS